MPKCRHNWKKIPLVDTGLPKRYMVKWMTIGGKKYQMSPAKRAYRCFDCGGIKIDFEKIVYYYNKYGHFLTKRSKKEPHE